MLSKSFLPGENAYALAQIHKCGVEYILRAIVERDLQALMYCEHSYPGGYLENINEWLQVPNEILRPHAYKSSIQYFLLKGRCTTASGRTISIDVFQTVYWSQIFVAKEDVTKVSEWIDEYRKSTYGRPENQTAHESTPDHDSLALNEFQHLHGVTWSQILITLDANGDSATIESAGIKVQKHFAQLGFLDSRKMNMPDSSWFFLKRIAAHKNKIDGSEGKLEDRFRENPEKWIQILRSRLRALLPPIQGDPLPKEKGGPWIAQFKLTDLGASRWEFPQN